MQPIINTLLDPVVNFGKVTVSPVGYSSLETNVMLEEGGSKLPNPVNDGSFNLVWFDSSTYSDPADDPKVEIVRCITRSENALILMRGQEGTLASTKNTPGKIYKMILAPTKKTIDDIGVGSASKTQIARNMSGDVRFESSPSIYSGTAEESTESQTPVEMTLLTTSFIKTGLRTFIQFSLEQMRTYYYGGYTCTTYLELSDGTTTLNSNMLYSNWYPFTVWTSSIDLFTLNNTTITVKVFTGGSVGYGSAVRNLKLYAPLTDTIN